MNLKVEHGIIALLLLTFLYYFYTHQSLLSDLSRVPDKGNPQLKAIKDQHAGSATSGCESTCKYNDANGNFGHLNEKRCRDTCGGVCMPKWVDNSNDVCTEKDDCCSFLHSSGPKNDPSCESGFRCG